MSSKNAYIRTCIAELEQRMASLAHTTVATRHTPEAYVSRVGSYAEMQYRLDQLKADLSKEVDDESDELEEVEPPSVPRAPDKLQQRRSRSKPRNWGG